jgi:hypothetical protein
MQAEELPLRSLVSDQRIAEIFAEEQISFGLDWRQVPPIF